MNLTRSVVGMISPLYENSILRELDAMHFC